MSNIQRRQNQNIPEPSRASGFPHPHLRFLKTREEYNGLFDERSEIRLK